MAKSALFHRAITYVRHILTAWNTSGEAIHSPYLFYIVRFIMRDKNAYYCFTEIERRRAFLLNCEDALEVVDFGSSGSKEGKKVTRRICDIAKGHLESAKVGQLLFRLALAMGRNEKRPLEILELGTSLGVTTAYLAAADSRNRVMTLEGSEAVLRVACMNWKALKLENIDWYAGNIDHTLFERAREKLDLVFVDANHTYEATMRYTDFLLPRMSKNGMIIVDDIHYSEGMERAWKALKEDPRVTTSMDLYHAGILFVNPCFLKRHYRILL